VFESVSVCFRACSLTYPACTADAPYCHCSRSAIFFDIYHIKSTKFEKRLLNIKCVFIFSARLSETFLILRRIQRDIVMNTKISSCKIPVILARFQSNMNFLDNFRKTQISNFVKIRLVGTELFHEDGRT
jgi:hypothetical protein